MSSAPDDDGPYLLDLKSKKIHCLTKRTFKIGWGGEYDITLPDEDCKGLCCEIVRQEKEVNLFPFSILTSCLINDAEVDEKTQLLHGSTVRLGKTSLFRYEATRSRSNRNSVSDDTDVQATVGPPPKPKRLQTKPIRNEMGTTDSNSNGKRTSFGELSDDWCVIVQPNIETDLIQQLQTPAQVAHLASSYMSRQLLMLTDMDISPLIVDQVFRALQEVAETNECIIVDFLRDFGEENKRIMKDRGMELAEKDKDAGGESPPPEPAEPLCHKPLIKLLLDLLRYSLDPVEHNILWTGLLAKLSLLMENHDMLLGYKAGAVLLGTMAAHLQSEEIQENTCSVLAQLAKYKPTPKLKGAVRQCAIELVVNAMERHLDKPNVLRPACRLLANVVDTTSEVTAMTPESEGFNAQEFDKMMVASLEMIDYIRDYALPVLEMAMQEYPKDFGINFDGKQVQEYFQSPSKFKYEREKEKAKAQKEAAKNIALEAKQVKKKKSEQKGQLTGTEPDTKTKAGHIYIHSLNKQDGGVSPNELDNFDQMKRQLNTVSKTPTSRNTKDGDGDDVFATEGAKHQVTSDDYDSSDYDDDEDDIDGRRRWGKPGDPHYKRERKKWGCAQEPVIPAELVGADSTIHSRRNMPRKGTRSPVQEMAVNKVKAAPQNVKPQKTMTTKNHSAIINFLGTLWLSGNQVQAVESLTKATEEILQARNKQKASKRDSNTTPDNCIIQTDPTVCANALNVFVSHKSKWTLTAAARVLPLTETLFANKILMRPAAEVVTLVLSLYGQDILKHSAAVEEGWPSPFNRDNREDLDVCFSELSKVHDQVDDAISRVSDSGIESEELIKRLQALQNELLSYNAFISLA
ncbi:uncharacterized protein LOC144438770 [Glandiceps talaboti]